MLRLAISEAVEKFREEFRTWLAANPPPRVTHDSSLETFQRVGREWQRRLSAGRWVGVHWPSEHGGRGLSLVEEAIVQEELVRADAPQILGLFGLTMVVPVLIEHGTEEQRKRFLARILSAEDVWCQGFSEPGAGSDLAAVRTAAKSDGQGFRVTGQKVWTSFAHVADYCFLLCRTSDEPERHKGLTYLLVDMRTPGITTRPLRQITGDEEFNEVFFDDVLVPSENVVGRVGDGWRIAISTLMYERVILTFARQLQSEVVLRDLLRRHGESGSAEVRAKLANELARTCAMRALAYEHLVSYAGGKLPGVEGSLDKLLWSESFQQLSKLALELAPREARASGNSPEVHRYLYSRGRTIAAGTSEIQRNIIAERLLKLPRLEYRFKKS